MLRSHNSKIGSSGLFLLAVLVSGACADTDETTDRSALLFGLTDTELQDIHARYLPNEDIEITRARLTAPFDCDGYGDFCQQIGAEGAQEVTRRQIELALDEEPIEAIEAQTRTWIAELADADDPAESDELEFRSSGPWTTQTIGDYRMRVRNGITTPVLGDRQAWTEAEVQHQDIFGAWWKKKATEICVNAGTNQQWGHFYGGGVPDSDLLLESFNPSESCDADVSSLTITTYHARNNAYENSGIGVTYEIDANGCATAEINSSNFSRCAGEYSSGF